MKLAIWLLFLFAIVAQGAPLPIQRNQWTTNNPGAAVDGYVTLNSNEVVNGIAIFRSGFETPFNYQSIPGLALQVDGSSLTNGVRITNWPGYGLSLTSTLSASPSVVTSALTGKVGALFSQTNYLTFIPTNNNNSLNTNCTIFVAFENTNRALLGSRYLLGGGRSHIQVGDGPSSGMGNDFIVWFDSSSGTYIGGNYFHQAFPSSSSNTVSAVGSFLFERGSLTWPSRVYAGINEFISPGMATNNTLYWPSSGICTLGAYPALPTTASLGFLGIVYEVVIYTNAISIGQYNAIQKYLAAKYKVRTQPFFYADGDAGFIGGAMGVDEKVSSPVLVQLHNSLLSHNFGIAASTIQTLDNIMTTATNIAIGGLSGLFSPLRTDNLYLLYYGTQAIYKGTNGITLWENVSNCLWSAKAQGYIVPVLTLLPTGSNDTERISFNSAAQKYWPIVGSILCDLTLLPKTAGTDFTNSLYYTGEANGYMPTTYQSSIVANFITGRLRQVCSTNLIPR